MNRSDFNRDQYKVLSFKEWIALAGVSISWMGEMGIQFAATCGTGPTTISRHAVEGQQTVDRWKLFLDANGHRTIGDVDAEFKREDQARIEALRNALKTGKLNGRKLSSKNRRLGQEEVYRSADRIG